MPRSGNVECYISTADGRLEEYQDPEQDEIVVGSATSVTRYIQSQAGQTFSATISISDGSGLIGSGATHMAFNVVVDGVPVKGCLSSCPLGYMNDHFPKSVTLKGPYYELTRRDFMFTNINLTEDVATEGFDKNTMSTVGELRIYAMRYKRTGTSINRVQEANSTRTFHEKDLKGRDISHNVGFSPPRVVENRGTLKGIYMDSIEHPFKLFRFLYRSRHALQSLGYIPRSPSPDPQSSPENKRPVEDMSPEELRMELLRMRNSRAENGPAHGVKREHASTIVNIKPDEGSSTASNHKKAKLVTIDLTDD